MKIWRFGDCTMEKSNSREVYGCNTGQKKVFWELDIKSRKYHMWNAHCTFHNVTEQISICKEYMWDNNKMVCAGPLSWGDDYLTRLAPGHSAYKYQVKKFFG